MNMYRPQEHSDCEIPQEILDLISEHGLWQDYSWHNDACASIVFEIFDHKYRLWADYPNKEHREFRDHARFSVSFEALTELDDYDKADICDAETTEEIISKLKELIAGYSKHYLTLAEFLATGVDCADLGVALEDDCLKGQPGKLYCGGLWVEKREENGKTMYYTLIERSEYEDEDEKKIATRLYLDFAVSNGYCDRDN